MRKYIVTFIASLLFITAASAREISKITLPTNDIIYDPVSGKIYASVPSTAGLDLGNTITVIDPVTKQIGPSVFVGSEPNRLAVSDDGQFIYVSLIGAAAVRRYNIAMQMAELQFVLGSDMFAGPLVAWDIEVFPGQANSVAIYRFANPGGGEDVAIYDDGLMRPTTTSEFNYMTGIVFSETAAVLYGSGQDSNLYTMSIDNSGVQITNSAVGILLDFNVDIEFDAGIVYATSGRVVDPDNSLVLGTYAARGFVEPVSAKGKTYILTTRQPGLRDWIIKIFDQSTFVFIDEFSIDEILGNRNPTSLIQWGNDGLAFRTDESEVFVISNVSVDEPIFLDDFEN